MVAEVGGKRFLDTFLSAIPVLGWNSDVSAEKDFMHPVMEVLKVNERGAV